jgi:hypothetical protein
MVDQNSTSWNRIERWVVLLDGVKRSMNRLSQ